MTAFVHLETVSWDHGEAGEDGVALVVFVGEVSLKWLKLLRPGFRHCFVLVYQQGCWVIYDPLSHRTNLAVISGPTMDELAGWYTEHGLRVIRTTVRRSPLRSAPLRPFTCVEAVKRVLGIHAPWISTPWQLYRHLVVSESRENILDKRP
jgi:hypothetical protein